MDRKLLKRVLGNEAAAHQAQAEASAAPNSVADTVTGRELDALVAIHLFGWTWKTHATTGTRSLLSPQSYPASTREWTGWQASDGSEPRSSGWDRIGDGLPFFSSDGNAIRLVCDWIRARPASERSRIAVLIQRELTRRVAPELLAIGSLLGMTTVVINSEPQDWCRAALKWVATELGNNNADRP